jgi:hypothetical protein
LFFEELTFSSYISSIELRSHILPESGYILTSDDIVPDGCLDRDRELSFRDIFLELFAYATSEIASARSVCHHREGIDCLSSDADIHFYYIILLISEWLVVEARISTRERLQIIIEIPHELTHRHLVVEDDTTRIEVGLIFKYSSSFLREIHKIAYIVVRRDHLDLRDRLFDMDISSWSWEILRIRYPEVGGCMPFKLGKLRIISRVVCAFISGDQDLIRHLWTRDDDVHVVLSPESLFHDIEVEKPEKSTSKSISERR